ncbi:MAG: peptide ABC transporter substrate-binding protein [Thermoleophilia bacterium]|nr:peptide ABC transporter substrate-binding protein [Thermoleophilia bacterium]
MSGLKGKLFFAVSAIVGAALVASGCGSSGGKGKDGSGQLAAKDKQVLNFNLGADPQGLDPAKASYVETINPLIAVFAPLYRLEGADSELTPYLGESLPEVSSDGLTYTVKMRTDAKWTDGTPVTASDAVWAAKYSLTPETAAPFSAYMTDIVGAPEMLAGKPLPAGGLGVKALDDHTVQYTLSHKTPWFKYELSLQTFWPLPEAAMKKYGPKWADPKNIVTNGPFKIESYTRRKSLVLVKNPTFFNADAVTLQKINMVMVGVPTTARKQFELGDLDTGLTNTMFPIEEIDKWKADSRFASTPTAAMNYMWFNTRNAALKDPKVRQGLALAIDRQSIVKNITKKGDVPLNTIIPNNLPGYDIIKEGSQDFIGADSKPDIAKAKELLKEGGWKDGTSLHFYYNSESPTAPKVAEAFQSDFAKVGVDLKLVPTPSAQLQVSGIGTSPIDAKVDMVYTGWIQDYPDAQDFYQFFTCPNIEGGLNNANFCDKSYDELYNKAVSTIDDDARIDLYKQLEAKLTGPDGAMPAAPIYQPVDIDLIQKWVKGIVLTPGGIIYFDDVKILDH